MLWLSLRTLTVLRTGDIAQSRQQHTTFIFYKNQETKERRRPGSCPDQRLETMKDTNTNTCTCTVTNKINSTGNTSETEISNMINERNTSDSKTPSVTNANLNITDCDGMRHQPRHKPF